MATSTLFSPRKHFLLTGMASALALFFTLTATPVLASDSYRTSTTTTTTVPVSGTETGRFSVVGPSAMGITLFKDKIFVANNGSTTVSMLTVAPLTVPNPDLVAALSIPTVANPNLYHLASIATGGQRPTAFAGNSNTGKLYLVNQGSTPGSGSVTAIDANTCTADTCSSTTIPTGGMPNVIAVNSTTNKIYIADSLANTVSIYNGANNGLLMPVVVGGGQHAIAIDEAAGKIYVTSYASSTVTVIDATTNMAIATVSVANFPDAITVNPSNHKVYVSTVNGASLGSVWIFDGNTIGTGSVPLAKVGVGASATPVNAIAYNPTSNKVYLSNSSGSSISIIDGTSNAVVTVKAGTQPGPITINPVSNQVYALNLLSNDVTAIDGSSNAVGRVVVALQPSSLTVDPATNRLFVATYNYIYMYATQIATPTTATIPNPPPPPPPAPRKHD